VTRLVLIPEKDWRGGPRDGLRSSSQLKALAQAKLILCEQSTYCAGGGKDEKSGDKLNDLEVLNIVTAYPNFEDFFFGS